MASKTGRNNKAIYTATATITIATSTTVSDAIDIGSSKLVGIVMPSTWTAADIKFQAAAPGSTTFNTVIDAAGNDVTVLSPVASKHVALSYVGVEGLGTIKVVSTNAQAGNRVLTLILKDE